MATELVSVIISRPVALTSLPDAWMVLSCISEIVICLFIQSRTVLWRNTHVNSQFVAGFGLDHLWSVFNTSELQATDVLTVLFLDRTKKLIFLKNAA